MPEKKFFGIESMSVDGKREFNEWYAKKLKEKYIFNFKKEMTKYCKMDVSILREACLKFLGFRLVLT